MVRPRTLRRIGAKLTQIGARDESAGRRRKA